MENLGTHELRTMVTEAADEAVNIGYRVGDTLHRWRERRAIAQGQEPIIVPSEGYGRVATGAKNGWVRILARALYKTEAFEKLLYVVEGTQDTGNPMRGWRAFTSIAMSDAPVTIIIAGRTYEVRTDRGGVLDVKLDIDLPAGLHEVIMYVPGSRAAVTSVYIVPAEQKIGVIADVDDTVMVTMLPRPLVAAWNSFVIDEHARIPTPGMAVLMDRIRAAHPQAPFMYLSTGAWNITPTLRRFLTRNGYPRARSCSLTGGLRQIAGSVLAPNIRYSPYEGWRTSSPRCSGSSSVMTASATRIYTTGLQCGTPRMLRLL